MVMPNTIRRVEEFEAEHALSLKLRAFTGPLSAEEADDLRTYWNDREAVAGFHSSNGEMIDAKVGFTRGGAVISAGTGSARGMPAATSANEYAACWSSPESERMARVGRALRRLSRDHLQILYRVFGPRDPNARYDLLGPLAPLAEYTPTVEETRRKMVADAVELRVREIEEREGHRRATSATVIAHARIRAEQAHDEIIRLRELRGERGLSDDERAELLQWRREERAAARRNEEAERGVEVDAAALRDRLITGIGREITTSMALSVLLTRAHREAARVALEAAALLRDASAAYRTPSGHTHDAR